MPSNQSVKPACYNYFFKSLTLHWLCIKTLDSLPGICMTACTSSTSYCCCWVVWRNLQHWIIILRLWGYLLMLYMHWYHFNLSEHQAHHRTSRICSRSCLSIPLPSVICTWIRLKILWIYQPWLRSGLHPFAYWCTCLISKLNSMLQIRHQIEIRMP